MDGGEGIRGSSLNSENAPDMNAGVGNLYLGRILCAEVSRKSSGLSRSPAAQYPAWKSRRPR